MAQAPVGQHRQKKKDAPDEAKRDLRAELDRLEHDIGALKIQFEQYFTGLVPLPPDKPHAQVKRAIRNLMKAPFRNSALNYRLKSLEARYNTLNTYWQRILKQKEDGTYSKDVFKAEIRERQALEEQQADTEKGKASRTMTSLFNSYKEALEKQSGNRVNLDFDAFQKSLIQRAKQLKEKLGTAKISFQVVSKDGKITIQAKAKSE